MPVNEQIRSILYKLKPLLANANIADAVDIEIDSSSFDGNLDSNVTDVQLLAQAVDDLSTGGGGTGVTGSVGGLRLDISPRVDVNTNIGGNRTVSFRVYNRTNISSLQLFVDRGGLFSTHTLSVPSSNGVHSQTVDIGTLQPTHDDVIVFYIVANVGSGNFVIGGAYIVNVNTIEGDEVTIDGTSLTNITVSNAQEVATALDSLQAVVNNLSGETRTRLGAITPFTGSVTVNAGNFENYDNEIGLYVAQGDIPAVDFTLPTEAVINNRYPVTITILHQGGTRRTTSVFNPTNEVHVQRQSPDTLRRTSDTGTLLSFGIVRRNDIATITKSAAGEPWVINVNTLSTGALLLPDGIFNLNQSINARYSEFNNAITLTQVAHAPVSGDAYRFTDNDEPDIFGGIGVFTDDVLVALVDNPNRIASATNTDWLIIRNATNSSVTAQELNFLNQITEIDTHFDNRLIDRSDVNEVNVWLSPFILDHAPFLNPSTDPNNPQTGETDEYEGGREDRGSDNEFEFSSNLPSRLVYIDIDGSFPVSELENVFLVQRDRDGIEISRHSLDDEFRPVVLTGSTDTYYVFDDIAAQDNFSSINYINGQTLSVVFQGTTRNFRISQSVDLIPTLKDASIPINKLSRNVQSQLNTNHALTHDQEKKLEGLTLRTDSEVIPNNFSFYAKLNSFSNDLSDYHSIEQQNGLLPDYERTITYYLLIPTEITTTQLQKVESTTTKQALTSHGVLSATDSSGNENIYNAFSVTLPAITGANSVLDNAWQIDGTRNTSVLNGAVDDFKIHMGNLDEDILGRLSHDVTPPTLPDNLQRLSRDLTVETRTESGWRELPTPIRSELTRQFAALWDENRRTFTGNYFDDLTPGIDIIGFATNTIFYYENPTDPLNTAFPGATSFIENDNIRFRNTSPNTTPISDGYNKIIGFDYALQRTLENDENEPMLRFGNTATPLLALADDEGLYLNIGRGDGGQHTRTYAQPLQVDNNQWGTRVGESIQGESEIIIPQSLTGSLDVNIHIREWDNDNDEGTHTETISITNLGSDQNFGSRTFNYLILGTPSTLTVTINYDAVNNDLSNTRRVLFVHSPVLTNAALHYDISADYTVTETWNTSTTYARRPVNAGDSHDDFGLFDPRLWTTEHVRERNRVLIAIEKYVATDTSSDPEMAVRMIVDGELENRGNKIRLHRPMSDFTFNDINFGNSICAISHVQCYDYEEDLEPTGQELQTLYSRGNSWLGAFTNRDAITDRFIINADIELQAGEGIILVDVSTGNRTLVELDNGALSFTTL